MTIQTSPRRVGSVLLKGVAASIAFVISLMIGSALAPMTPSILAKTPSMGILSTAGAMVVSAIVDAVILVWVAERSTLRGLALIGQLFILSFGVQTFQTQIETGYFISAFPLLQGNFELYLIMLRGLITSAVFAVLVALIVHGLSKAPGPASRLYVDVRRALRQSAWLAAVYIGLYMLFGYFVAWQSQELRLFYGGSAQLNSLFNQWAVTLMTRPELPVFQYFRGVLWILCLIPVFMAFSGKRLELVILSALALGLLPTVELAFPNPLMPAGVSQMHFWEVSTSNAIFGALCAWFVPSESAETEGVQPRRFEGAVST
jgi:hypothetical protein